MKFSFVDCQDSQIARMNYGAALRAKSLKKSLNGKLTLTRVIQISLLFTAVVSFESLLFKCSVPPS